MKLWNKIKKLLNAIDSWNKEELADMHERELLELEHIFALLNLGIVVGLPMPPLHITAELLPLMEEETQVLFSRLNTAMDPMGELFSVFDID